MTKTERARRYRRLADYIERQPAENFQQRSWFCGSAACVAGHSALMLGWTPITGALEFKVQRKGRVGFAGDIAQRYLGLTDAQSSRLFKAHAPWQTRDAAVAELRRRAEKEER